MSPPITDRQPRGLTRLLARAPILLFRARLGWLLGNRFLMLTHTGRMTGRPRQVVLEVVRHDKTTDTYVVASAWGERSDWYRNIRRTPEVTVNAGRRRLEARAERLPLEEAERELAQYARRYPTAARSLSRLMGYPMDDLETGFPALSRHLPIVALRPRSSADS
jgi:deazaflavin-dependent oxidoreductase (nitroreductase family)